VAIVFDMINHIKESVVYLTTNPKELLFCSFPNKFLLGDFLDLNFG